MTDVKSAKCPHVGVLHPMFFDCIDCYDTAYECNCFDCMGAFCHECNTMIMENCEDIREAWMKKNPDKDIDTEYWRIKMSKKEASP